MNETEKKELLRKIPSVEKLLSVEEFKMFYDIYPKKLVCNITKKILEKIRTNIINNYYENTTIENLYKKIKDELEKWDRKGVKRAINATGIVLNTNLGRAPMSKNAIKRLNEITKGYSTLEIDSETGKRGRRTERIEELLKELIDIESAIVVNNDSAAVFLILQSLAKNKEVIISRGELVEIGGSFRIPEIMEKSGCRLVEVGTTNKTRISDYEKAITNETAMILKVHTSNFKITGFTESVSPEELSQLARNKGIILFYDQGNGLIRGLKNPHIDEPDLMSILKGEIDIIAFSGDKLFGGPQSGIIIGKKKYLDIIKKDPLMRAMRVDKMTLACLEATIEDYLFSPEETIPIINMLEITGEELKNKARNILNEIMEYNNEYEIKIIEGTSEAGGGTLPGITLPTFFISIKSPSGVNKLQEKLRKHKPPIYTRIIEDKITLDMRTITDNDINELIEGLKIILKEGKNIIT